MRVTKILGVACALAMGASSALAGTVTFDFTTAPTSGGNTWTVNAGVDGDFSTTAIPLSPFSPVLTLNGANGLGVGGFFDGSVFDGDPYINPLQGISFSFTPPDISLDTITFTLVDKNGIAFIFPYGDFIQITDSLGTHNVPSNSGTVSYNFAANATGPLTVTDGLSISESFGIKSINISYTSADPQAASVPLPASVWSGLSLLGGLAGLTFVRRRRRV